MGKNLQKQFPFRTDYSIIKKIDYIADANTRNRNQQIEHCLKKCIADYEALHGELLVDEDGNVTTAKPKAVEGKSFNSKIG